MLLVESYEQLIEQVALWRESSGQKPDAGETDRVDPVPADSPDRVSDTIVTVCHHVLDQEPELVARLASGQADSHELKSLVSHIIEHHHLIVDESQPVLLRQVNDFLFGYGPLQSLVDDEAVSDIDGTGPSEFTVTREGRRERSKLRFPDEKAYDTFCRLVIIRNGGMINENDSHCRVADSQYRLRINVTIPPRSVNFATISIRKHRQKALDLDDLCELGMLDRPMADQLRRIASEGQSLLLTGRGAAGKTTLLRAFIAAMPPLERVLIAESDSEIYPDKPSCLVQRIKKPHEGGRPVSLRDLVADGLTMSLETYCIGEIVGEEALEFIRAAFSGHRCLATLHADSAADAMDRLIALAAPAMRSESERLLRRMLGRSLDYIVHLESFKIRDFIRIRGYHEGREHYEWQSLLPEKEDPAADSATGQPAVALVPGT